MGQYFRIVNLTKKQYINPRDFDDDPKLMEFGCSSNGVLLALAILTSNGNGRGMGDLHLPDYSPLIKKEMAAYHKSLDSRRNLPVDKWPDLVYPDHTPSPHFDIVGSWAGDRIVTAGDSGDRWRWITKAQGELVIAARIADGKAQAREEKKRWTAEDEKRCRSYGADLHDVAGLCYENVSPKVLRVLELCHEGPFAGRENHFEFVRGWMTRQVDRDYWAGRFFQVGRGKKKRPCWDLTDLTGEMLDAILRAAAKDAKRFRGLVKWFKQQKITEPIRLLLDCYKPNTAKNTERHNFERIKQIVHEHLGGRQLDQVRRVLPDENLLRLAGVAWNQLSDTMTKLNCDRPSALLYLANEIAQRAPAPADQDIPSRERSITIDAKR